MDLPACPRHRDLVARVLDGDPTDDELDAYADVADCPACQAALSRSLGVHPRVLELGGTSDPEEGRHAVLAALDDAPWLRLRTALGAEVPTRTVRLGWIGLAVAIAAAVALWVWPEAPAPEPPPVQVTAPELPPPNDDAVAEADVEAEPEEVQVAPPEPPAPPPTPRAEPAADWAPPPYVDLRGGAAKSGTPINSVQLQLAPRDGLTVGSAVSLAVVTGVATELAVCVSGPEQGVVWRGAVPGGRTPLARDGREQAFAFDRPGTWRFTASTADLTTCADPVHVVTVEVR